MRSLLSPTILLFASVPATAQVPPRALPLCADRPGKATPACVVAPGVVQVETSVLDWARDDTGGVRTDVLLFADTLVKFGIGGDTEARVSFTPYIRSRRRGPDGSVSVADGFGDVGLSLRHRFLDGGDADVSIAAQPFVSLPVGGDAVSAGAVTGGVTLPIDIPLPNGWILNFTPTVAAAADADGDGRHPLYSGVVAVGVPLGPTVGATAELFVQRDRDPLGRTTQTTADLLLAWQPAPDWQLDVSTYVGLSRDAPGLQLLGGFTRRF